MLEDFWSACFISGAGAPLLKRGGRSRPEAVVPAPHAAGSTAEAAREEPAPIAADVADAADAAVRIHDAKIFAPAVAQPPPTAITPTAAGAATAAITIPAPREHICLPWAAREGILDGTHGAAYVHVALAPSTVLRAATTLTSPADAWRRLRLVVVLGEREPLTYMVAPPCRTQADAAEVAAFVSALLSACAVTKFVRSGAQLMPLLMAVTTEPRVAAPDNVFDLAIGMAHCHHAGTLDPSVSSDAPLARLVDVFFPATAADAADGNVTIPHVPAAAAARAWACARSDDAPGYWTEPGALEAHLRDALLLRAVAQHVEALCDTAGVSVAVTLDSCVVPICAALSYCGTPCDSTSAAAAEWASAAAALSRLRALGAGVAATAPGADMDATERAHRVDELQALLLQSPVPPPDGINPADVARQLEAALGEIQRIVLVPAWTLLAATADPAWAAQIRYLLQSSPAERLQRAAATALPAPLTSSAEILWAGTLAAAAATVEAQHHVAAARAAEQFGATHSVFRGGTTRVHPLFDCTAARTGRIFVTNPNLQTLPRGGVLRRALVAPAGASVLAIDYAQFELRVAAHLSGDDALIAAFQQGRDVVGELGAIMAASTCPGGVLPPAERGAAIVTAARGAMKRLLYGLLYGMGEEASRRELALFAAVVGRDAAIPRPEAVRVLTSRLFPRLMEWVAEVRRHAEDAPSLRTHIGRVAALAPRSGALSSSNRGGQAVAMLVQGTAAEILKAAMLRIHRTDPATRTWTLLFPLHDELVFAVATPHLHATAATLAAAMRMAGQDVAALCGAPGGFRVPLEVQCKSGAAFGTLTPLSLDSE